MEFNFPMLLIGLIFFGVGVLLLVKQLQSRKNNTSPATATVVSYFISESHSADPDTGGDSISYFPIMRYWAAGQWYEQKSDLGSGKEKYAIGERVNILYDPRHPEHFSIVGDKSSYIVSAIGIAIGAAVIILSFVAK